jgi:hypothetical protein
MHRRAKVTTSHYSIMEINGMNTTMMLYHKYLKIRRSKQQSKATILFIKDKIFARNHIQNSK